MLLTRRNVITGIGALACAGAFAGCGSGSDETAYIIADGESGTAEPEAETAVHHGAMGNNCGGRCLIAAHVQNGVIKRFTTDERPDGDHTTTSDPQKRACHRCRGKRSEIYKSDRLVYPLKRLESAERGDPEGFVRISWQQAFDEIAEKLKKIVQAEYSGSDPYFNLPQNKGIWGMGTCFAPYGGGAPFSMPAPTVISSNLFKAIGGNMDFRAHALSFPGTYHIDRLVVDSNLVIVPSNYPRDLLNCQQIVLWGINPADAIQGCNTTYMLIQARNKGIPITVVDPHFSRTSAMLGCKHLAPTGGTDAALVMAILYHLIKKQLAESDVNNGKWLDFNFIKKAVHGFFDLPKPVASDFYSVPQPAGVPMLNPQTPQTLRAPADSDADAQEYRVPAGASWSAFILGNETDLVAAGVNYAASIYPDTIGYNVNSAQDAPDGAADPLYNKRVPIYGQLPKTPEWAALITGVPADEIKAFAEMLGTTKHVGMMTGWGSNRTIENEQAPWAVDVLAAVLGYFGDNGRFWGEGHMVLAGNTFTPGAAMPAMSSDLADRAKMVDNNIINFHRMNRSKFSFTNTSRTANGFGQYDYTNGQYVQMSSWQDMAANGGTGKSFWNNPEVKYCPPLKCHFLYGYNPINQTGDNKKSMEIVKMKDAGGKYKLELIVSLDVFMSPSAQYADYVLPAAMPFEQEGYTLGGTALFHIPKIISAPGEALPEKDIAEGILKSFQPGLEKEIMGNKNIAQLCEDGFGMMEAYGTSQGLTYDEFKKRGILDYASVTDLVQPLFKAYRALLEGKAGGAPLSTTSGKVEAYCQGLVEDYEARRWYNFDDDPSRYGGTAAALYNVGQQCRDGVTVEGIYSKSCNYGNNKDDNPHMYTSVDANGLPVFAPVVVSPADNMKKARFVYPIPMYIPIIEGLHACDDRSDYTYMGVDMRHPDPLGLKSSYPLVCGNHHSIYRAHSSVDNSPYSNETYKRDGKGNPAFRNPDRGVETVRKGKGVEPAGELGVYEPLDLNPADAKAMNLKTGDLVMVTSPRAGVLLSVNVTHKTRKGITRMAEGAWSTFKNCRITFEDGTSGTYCVDVAGSANSLSMQRPSRICQGNGYGSYQRIKIQKVTSVEPA